MTDNFKVGDVVEAKRDYPWIGQMVKGKQLRVIERDDSVAFSIYQSDNLDELGTVQVNYANDYASDFILNTRTEDVKTTTAMIVEEVSTRESMDFALAKRIDTIPSLGVYRPDINTRKVGKVGVHMTIDGFPNALMEVSRVMQWAADNKGYKLHDWKNLPEAEVSLSSAGYRHMLENSIQKALDVSPADRVDHESELLHLAHQAFNILAQIELIKTGKIQ